MDHRTPSDAAAAGAPLESPAVRATRSFTAAMQRAALFLAEHVDEMQPRQREAVRTACIQVLYAIDCPGYEETEKAIREWRNLWIGEQLEYRN
jgi:hypothetical protein